MCTDPQLQDSSRHMEEKAWWDLWNSSYRSEDNRDKVSAELFAHVVGISKQVIVGPIDRVLEVACGTGTLSRQLNFSNYHGLDMSPAAIEIACQKAASLELPAGMNRPTYEAADFHSWAAPAECFDLVLCVDAISCFRDQQFALRKMAQILPARGIMILTTVNPLVYNRIRRVNGVKLENGPVSRWLSRSELHRLVRQAGFTIVQSYTIMPRGNMGFLRVVNSSKLNRALSRRGAAFFRRLKERSGWGQYRVLVARKEA
jgi:2-polyprenyl-3-methyl-5-hydroxy-6-metoxy-1,4-benzoquinol methylase